MCAEKAGGMRNEYLPACGEAGCEMERGAERVVQCSNLPQQHDLL